MKLSDAIALGRTLVISAPGGILYGDGSGCALGMAGVARGLLNVHSKTSEMSYHILEKEWPWLRVLNMGGVCNCSHWGRGQGIQIIGHLFDHHVSQAKDWSLDQLIDWVRSVEPAEEEAPVAAESACRSAPARPLAGGDREPRVLAAK